MTDAAAEPSRGKDVTDVDDTNWAWHCPTLVSTVHFAQPNISIAFHDAHDGVISVVIRSTLAICSAGAIHVSRVPIFMKPDQVLTCCPSIERTWVEFPFGDMLRMPSTRAILIGEVM